MSNDGNLKMKNLQELENRVWKMIEEATADKDTQTLGKLNQIAEKLKGLKTKFDQLQDQLESIEKSSVSVRTDGVSWKVTAGAIRQDLLNIKEAKNAGLLPPDGSSITVETEYGGTFTSEVIYSQNKLKERGEVRKFYETEKVQAGDTLILKPLGNDKFLLKKEKTDQPTNGTPANQTKDKA